MAGHDPKVDRAGFIGKKARINWSRRRWRDRCRRSAKTMSVPH